MSKYKMCELDDSKSDKKKTKMAEMMDNPKYICKKCDLEANKESYVCKPKKIK